jgi:rhamnosyltransferase
MDKVASLVQQDYGESLGDERGNGLRMSQTVEMFIQEGTSHVPAVAFIGVIVPTYNAAPDWQAFSDSLSRQGIPPEQILIIDSSSSDSTRELARKSGYRVVGIPKEEFGHGSTRQLACGYFPQAELLVFLTQDAVLNQSTSLQLLCEAFDDPSVGAALGRQVPRREAGAIERHARFFNYPMVSQIKTFESRRELGIKAAFSSNSFAAYRRAALEQVGGFPSHVILGEDTYVAAKLLMNGWKLAYVANASVIHSHGLTLWQEFQRYFDTGVLHHREIWLLETFGRAGNEGLRFVKSEFKYLRDSGAWHLMPIAALRTITKLLAYRLGHMEHKLPLRVKRTLSMSSGFWSEKESRRALDPESRSSLK